MKFFVSYSRRDGVVTEQMLRLLQLHLRDLGTPFIHCLQSSNGRWEQLKVMRALIASNVVLLIDSPAARTSPWVKLELLVARLFLRPILRLDAVDLGVPGEAYRA
jgi:ABC-type arginine transport system ATPase subunit